jgi:two-component system response regulator PrrA
VIHVLIIDDDAATLDSLAEALELAGFSVATASGGEAGLREAQRRRPAVVLVDYQMPGMTGAEFIERMYAIPSLAGVCAILATAWPDLPEGIDPSVIVVEKPFSITSLLHVLARCGVRPEGDSLSMQ